MKTEAGRGADGPTDGGKQAERERNKAREREEALLDESSKLSRRTRLMTSRKTA